MVSSITQKERTILQDQLRHEEVCIRKYLDYARRTGDTTLRGLFNEFAQDERDHFNTLNGLLGRAQGMGQQSAGQQQGVAAQQQGVAAQQQRVTAQQAGPVQRQAIGQATSGTTGGNLTARLTDEEFIRTAAEQKLQGMGLGQPQVQRPALSQQPGQPQQASPSQQPGQSRQSGQSRNWPDTDLSDEQAGQRTTQQSNQSFQEASRELIPMFGAETAQGFAAGSGAAENEVGVARDMLMTEQFVSGSYDSAIFDSISPQVRQTLQHIQKDEQKHGQGLRNYLQQRGMNQ